MRAIDEQLRRFSPVLHAACSRKSRACVAAMLLFLPLLGLACTKSPPAAEPVAVKQTAEELRKAEAPAETPKKADQPSEEPTKPEPVAEQPKQAEMPAPQQKKPETQVAKLETSAQKAPEPKKEAPKPVPGSDKVSVTVRCDPSTATVLIDGKATALDQGKAKLKLPIDFAKLEVNATAANHVAFDKSLSRAEIDAAKKVIAIRLNPYLRIEQKNADVWVAGKPLTADAERRYELQRNADDRYQLIVTCPGFTSFTGTLTYEELRQREFTLSLGAEAKRDTWLARAGKLTRQPPWQSHTNTVYAVAFSQKDRLLASASRDGWVKLSSYPEKEQSGSLSAANAAEFKQDKPVLAVAFSRDGQWLATGGADKKARLWNVQSRQTVAEFANDDWVWSVAFSHDSKTLATALGDGSVSLWNVAARSRIGDPKQLHDETIACIAFSPDDRTLASAGADGSVGLWVVGTTETAMLRNSAKAVHCVAFSPDGKTLASGGDDNAITLWDTAKRQKQATLENDGQPVRCLAFSPDGEVLASGGGEKAVKLWNVADKAMRQSLSFNEEAYGVAFGPSNWLLAAGGGSGGVAVWRSSVQQEQKK